MRTRLLCSGRLTGVVRTVAGLVFDGWFTRVNKPLKKVDVFIQNTTRSVHTCYYLSYKLKDSEVVEEDADMNHTVRRYPGMSYRCSGRRPSDCSCGCAATHPSPSTETTVRKPPYKTEEDCLLYLGVTRASQGGRPTSGAHLRARRARLKVPELAAVNASSSNVSCALTGNPSLAQGGDFKNFDSLTIPSRGSRSTKRYHQSQRDQNPYPGLARLRRSMPLPHRFLVRRMTDLVPNRRRAWSIHEYHGT